MAESRLIGQSLVLAKATRDTGLERVSRRYFESKEADALLSLSWAVAAGYGQMDLASVWLEQNDCPAHNESVSSADISKILGAVSQSQIEDFLREWTQRGKKGLSERHFYDMTLESSHNMSNPFGEWGLNRDEEDLARINMTTLIDVTSRLPTYYEIHPGSMSDAKTVASFITRMKKYGAERIRVLLDRDFYSALNISLARRPYKLLHPRAHNGRLARRIN